MPSTVVDSCCRKSRFSVFNFNWTDAVFKKFALYLALIIVAVMLVIGCYFLCKNGCAFGREYYLNTRPLGSNEMPRAYREVGDYSQRNRGRDRYGENEQANFGFTGLQENIVLAVPGVMRSTTPVSLFEGGTPPLPSSPMDSEPVCRIDDGLLARFDKKAMTASKEAAVKREVQIQINRAAKAKLDKQLELIGFVDELV